MTSCEIIEAKPLLLGIKLERSFPLGFGSLEHLPRVLYAISALDKRGVVSGIGEASIDFPFSTYDAWDIFWALSQLDLTGRNLEDRETILRDSRIRKDLLGQFPAAFTALNMALDDVWGKFRGKSVLDMYGQRRKGGHALASIAFQNETSLLVEEIEDKLRHGFIPKPKVGKGKGEDLDTIKTVALLSKERNIPFVLDFNAQNKPEEFRELIRGLKNMGTDLSLLIFIEQPTNEESGIEGLVYAQNSLRDYGYNTPVVADESFVTLTNAIECAKAGIFLNFKLHKIGGLYYAHEIESAILSSSKLNLENMVGGTFPTAIGRVYDQHAAATLRTTTLPGDGWEPSTDWFQDEKHLIEEGFCFDQDTNTFMPTKGNGLGIHPNWSKIDNYVIDHPREEYTSIRKGKSGKILKIDLKPGQTYPEKYEERTGRKPDWNL